MPEHVRYTATKARWAAGGGGIGGALAEIVTWGAAQYGMDAAPIEGALAIVLGAAGAGLAAYLGPGNQTLPRKAP